jgi:hypothetical protein
MNLVHLGEMAEFHPDAHVGKVVQEHALTEKLSSYVEGEYDRAPTVEILAE